MLERLKVFCKKILILFAACFISVAIHGQQTVPKPQSPEAAALSKALDYPVKNNTGSPNISIPLFDVLSGELGYNVMLSYQAGGVRVGQLPTWV